MNTICSASQMGVLGIRRGMQQVERGAATTASPESLNGAQENLTESLLDMKAGKLQAQASAKAVHAADDVIGSLLDAIA